MKTTVNLNDDLFQRAKTFAVRHRRTLTSPIEDAPVELLNRTKKTGRRRPLRLRRSSQPPGTRAGVDLGHSAALLDVMENATDRDPL